MIGRNIHLSFVFLAIVVGSATAAEQEILEMGATEWKYLDTAEGPGEGWYQSDFDDSKWKSGQVPLGYGDSDIKQTVSFGDNDDAKNICVFFRRTVEVDDPTAVKKIVGKVICDDGCAVYVNGEEVHRHNLKDGELKNDTTSSITVAGEIERHPFTFLIDASKFKSGSNVVAVRVHQRGAESSDLAINLSLTGLNDDAEIASAQQTHDAEQAQIKAAVGQGF